MSAPNAIVAVTGECATGPRPSGRGSRDVSGGARDPSVAVIAHVYYWDLWPEISHRLRAWDIKFRLHVTTTHERFDRIAAAVKAEWPHAVVASAPNRGRDMASFLQQARVAVDEGADLLCKIHTKKSPHRADGEQWRKDLYRKVLGERGSVRLILEAFSQDVTLGIVAPEGHAVSSQLCWDANAARVLSLAARVGYQGDPTPFVFAAGSMFWVRTEALRPILDLALTFEDFEEEAFQLDGTLAHALERLFPIAAKMGGYQLVDTRVIAPGRRVPYDHRSPGEAGAFHAGAWDRLRARRLRWRLLHDAAARLLRSASQAVRPR